MRAVASTSGLTRIGSSRMARAGEHRASPVRFVGLWRGGAPPFAAGADIADRRGCDNDPIDVSTDDGAQTLLSYVWPEPERTFCSSASGHRTRATRASRHRSRRRGGLALGSARGAKGRNRVGRVPLRRVAIPRGTHSRRAGRPTRGSRSGRHPRRPACVATTRAPSGHVRARGTSTHALGRPHGSTRRSLLASTSFHGGPVEWLAELGD